MIQLDSGDRKLLNLVQKEFPFVRRPYASLGCLSGSDEVEVIRRITGLKGKGIVRMIGPVLDSRSLGYMTTLVAMKVAESQLEKAEKVIAGHPGVSHGYEREHRFNVWFTLAVPPNTGVEAEVEQLARAAGAEEAISLPAVKVFKIGTYFDMVEDGQNVPVSHGGHVPAGQGELSSLERSVINALQQDLPLVSEPFDALAEKVGTDVEQFLSVCRSLQQRGIIRRFSASINHNRAGFTANAMSCWVASQDIIDVAAQKMISLKEVSHCYERKTGDSWRYNLFAMIHCRSRDTCRALAETLSRETGLTDFNLLYSTREFKKTRVKYLV